VADSTITGNSAGTSGGGVHNDGTLTVTNSTIAGNSAETRGGGVHNGGTLTVTNSTITGNSARSGGGMANPHGTLTVTDSTITGNSAASIGGGVSNSGFGALARTLVSGNTAPFGPEMFNFGTLSADDYNLFGVDGQAGVEGFHPGPTDVVPAAGVRLRDMLRRLADNGGPTRTHALVPGSPALDAIPPTDPGCTGTDQRGVPRPQGSGCDIGAVERRVR
jgi:hypothetical protein